VDETAGFLQGIWYGFLDHLPQILGALGLWLLCALLGRGLRAVVQRALQREDATLARMLGQLAGFGMSILGVLLAFWILFPTINFREIFASLGLTGLILGFALKDLIENFVAGLLILWRRPFHVGDQIRSGNFEGTVQEINFRSTILETYSGVQVFVPNGKVFTEPLENFTGYPARRLEVILGIDQQASVGQARAVILEELQEVPGVLRDPAPLVFFEQIGDFSNLLHVLVWTQPPTRLSERQTHSDVTERLYAALLRAGIAFPYPIRTVQLERVAGGDNGVGGLAARVRGHSGTDPHQSRA
jgi:small-conductance mechanosensitive channel